MVERKTEGPFSNYQDAHKKALEAIPQSEGQFSIFRHAHLWWIEWYPKDNGDKENDPNSP